MNTSLLRSWLVGTIATAGVLTVIVAGCSSSDDGGAAPASPDAGNDAPVRPDAPPDTATGTDAPVDIPVVPVAGVCKQQAEKACAFLTTCAPKFVSGLWADPADCPKRFEENCIASFPPNAEVRKDDAEKLIACLGALTCDALYGPKWTLACDVPRLKIAYPDESGPCRIDSECEGRSCSGNLGTCGRCMKRLTAGAQCTNAAQCPKGGICSGNLCVVPAFLGDPCDANIKICGNGLTCTGGKCVKAGGVGTPCTNDSACDTPSLIQCNYTTQQCDTTTFAAPSEPCPAAFSGPPVACTKASSCVRPVADQPGTCVSHAKVGEACGNDKPCETFINCRGGKCVLPLWSSCP